MSGTFELRNLLDKEFDKESDRGCAILTVCLLEEALAHLFAVVLPGGERAARNFMPKGRLSAGVANAHALGLLNDSMQANFKVVLEIRNAFAHKLLGDMTFQSDEIRRKVDSLQLPNMDAVPDVLTDINRNPRRRFMMVIDSLFFSLEWLAGRSKPFPKAIIPAWSIRPIPRDWRKK